MTDYTDIDKLRELAEAATPGPWAAVRRQTADAWDPYRPDAEMVLAGGKNLARVSTGPNAEFIAAASPDVILALVAELVGLRTEVDQLRGERRRCAAIGHPTVTPESLIPCQLDQDHEGDHYSTSGCSGGAVSWPRAEAERDALQAERDELLLRVQSSSAGAAVLDQYGAAQRKLAEVMETRWRDSAAELAALQAEVELLRAQLSCSCTPYPYGEGPEEDCAVHGRGYDWWVGLAKKACEDRAALQVRIDAVTALHTKSRRATGFSSLSGVTSWAETCDYCSQRHVGGYETVRWPCDTIRALGVDPQTPENGDQQ